MDISMRVNGRPVQANIPPQTLLVELLRDRLGLTGTHVGCDTNQCGACVVHLDGAAVKSCTLLAVSAQGCDVTTIEGIAGADGTLHPMQQAFHEHHALQCGFCTPGMVMTALAFAAGGDAVSEPVVRHALEGNLCRCTGYQNIVAAVIAGTNSIRANGNGG